MESRSSGRIRRMRRNHGTETPSNLLFLDVESVETVHREKPRSASLSFRLVCSTHIVIESGSKKIRREMVHHSIQEFWEWVEECQSKRNPLWVFAHNLAFDLTQLEFWRLLEDGVYRAGETTPGESGGVLSGGKSYRGKLAVDGHPFFVYCLGRKGVCKFVDSMNYFPEALAALGESIGRPKQTFPGFSASVDALVDYCKNDVSVIESAITQMMDRWRIEDCGVWQPTAAMLALTSFRHRLPVAIGDRADRTIVLGEKPEWSALERASYYGGQTSCFYLGAIVGYDDSSNESTVIMTGPDTHRPTGPLYHLDVRSLYPSVMERHLYPFRRLYKKTRISVRELEKLSQGYGVAAWVRIESDADEYTTRVDGRQMQCTGRMTTALCGPELSRALGAGHVTDVIECQVYCMDQLFKPWVDHWWKQRKDAQANGDKFTEKYVKLVLNALSGKFAQRGDRWVERPEKTPLMDWGRWYSMSADTGEVRHWRGIAGQCQERVVGEEPWYSFPAISGWICAYGREHMRHLRGLCPPRSVLYQATDSLIVTQSGYDSLVSSGMVGDGLLGRLRLIETAMDGEVRGCNHYRMGDRYVRSGSWGRAYKNEDGHYVYDAWDRSETILQSRPTGSVGITTQYLTSEGEYTKGVRLDGGWIAWPHLPLSDTPF